MFTFIKNCKAFPNGTILNFYQQSIESPLAKILVLIQLIFLKNLLGGI